MYFVVENLKYTDIPPVVLNHNLTTQLNHYNIFGIYPIKILENTGPCPQKKYSIILPLNFTYNIFGVQGTHFEDNVLFYSGYSDKTSLLASIN